MRHHTTLIAWLIMGSLLCANAIPQPPTTSPPPELPPSTKPNASTRSSIIQPGDRVLFLGDDMTQQMFYTRGVGSALLGALPDARLRFYNGGRDGATVTDALTDAPVLLDLTHATVVFICYGLNDARVTHDPDQSKTGSRVEDFSHGLRSLIDTLRTYDYVRQIVIIGPPATQIGLNPHLDSVGYAHTLKDLSRSANEVAAQTSSHFIDLYEHMKLTYDTANTTGGEPLTHGGWLPTEEAHVVIASVILRGIGVTPRQLNPIGWSPLRPIEMRRVRQILGIPLEIPDLGLAQMSRDLYESMRHCDERFFRLWRVSKRRNDPDAIRAQQLALEEAWRVVEQYAKQSASVNPQTAPQTAP